MYPFLSLPAIYKLVIMLGGRVQVYAKRQEQWFDYQRMIGIDSRTLIRVAAGDENILEKARELVSELYEKVIYKEYDYLVPKNAMKDGSLIIMSYGFGEIVRVNANLELIKVSEEEQKELFENYNMDLYRSESEETFQGIIPKD